MVVGMQSARLKPGQAVVHVDKDRRSGLAVSLPPHTNPRLCCVGLCLTFSHHTHTHTLISQDKSGSGSLPVARVPAPHLIAQSAAEKTVNTTSKADSYLSRFLEDAPAPKPKGHARSASGDKGVFAMSPSKDPAILRASADHHPTRSKSHQDVSRPQAKNV